jgi:hypothetical protein
MNCDLRETKQNGMRKSTTTESIEGERETERDREREREGERERERERAYRMD